MEKEQYDKLMEAASKNAYMSIAVNEDGSPVRGGFVPWERTTSAFNMRTPEVTLSVSDLQDEKIMDALRSCDLAGCYLFTALPDYGFLSDFTGLRDLFILHGENIRDLSFLRSMSELFMFYLEDATLPDLRPLVDCCNASKSFAAKCLGFYRCRVEDTSALSDVNCILSEFLVWPVSGDTRERWKTARKPGVFKFYERKEQD